MIRKVRDSTIIILALAILFVSGCGKMVTKGEEFPLLYEEKPTTILILPPINESTAADAKEYYSTTIQVPLSFTGYYVYPYEVTAEILKTEGVYDAELLRNLPLTKFREYFGADAVLFTTIKKWDMSYMVLASTLTVSIDADLKSTKTSETLWKYNGTVVVDLSGGQVGGGGCIGLVAVAVTTAIKSATADYVPYARMANTQALVTMPYGPYHKLHGNDQAQQFADQTPEKK